MKSIHNPELFTRDGRFIIQWLQRESDKDWIRRQARVSNTAAASLRRMTIYEQLEWIAKRLPEPVNAEQPEV